jgi:hypothetical protein
MTGRLRPRGTQAKVREVSDGYDAIAMAADMRGDGDAIDLLALAGRDSLDTRTS